VVRIVDSLISGTRYRHSAEYAVLYKGSQGIRPMHLRTIADLLITVLTEDQATDLILAMHDTGDGADTLRRIVRDNIGGAGDLITNALWFRMN